MPVFIGRQQHGVFATDSATTPTKLYIYARGVSTGEQLEAIGRQKKDKTLVDGSVTDWMQSAAAGWDAAALNTASIEIDNDANSPFEGEVRLVLALS